MDEIELYRFIENNDEWKNLGDLILAPPDRHELKKEWPDADDQVLNRCRELISKHVTRGAHYWMMRSRGANNSFAAMIALQQGPGLNTDDVFFSGQKPLYEQFGSQQHLDRYLKASKKRGFTPNPHSTYFPGLARFQGDPEAYVTRAQGRSYIRELIERRGGKFDIKSGDVSWHEPESDPLAEENCTPLAEDIIRGHAAEMVKSNPDVARMDRKKLRQEIIEKHGPSKVK